jgi:CubicO group peptidase (beta-lactamase class C family)
MDGWSLPPRPLSLSCLLRVMSRPPVIEGHCDARFVSVRDAFAANFEAGREVGASFAVTVDGELVVDVWGGYADAARTRPWKCDTIINVFSTTKAMAALCAHILVDRGQLDLNAPVAQYWPEFAKAGKERITTRHVLSHAAGLAGIRQPLATEALFDWTRMTEALAAEAPWWEPGTANGYHALTYGYLVGEIVRRITGKTLGAFFRDDVAERLGADFHIGLPASEDPRVAELVPASAEEVERAGASTRIDPETLSGKVVGNPPLRAEFANRPEWRRAEIPAANGHGNARSVARIMGLLACGGRRDGVQLLKEQTIAQAIEEQSYADDLVLGFRMRWALGFMLTSRHLPVGPNPRTFGHGGWGGSLGFADPDARVGWAYIMNKMSPVTAGDTRVVGILAALYGVLSL